MYPPEIEPPRKVEEDIQELLPLIGRLVRYVKGIGPDPAELKGLLDAAGLGPRHLPALIVLSLYGPSTVGAVAERLLLSPATASQLIGELRRAGFVESRTDPADRRRVIVTLDDGHRALLEKFARDRVAPMDRALNRLTEDERASFVKGWRIMLDTMAEDVGPLTPEK